MKTEYKDKEKYLNSYSALGYDNDSYMDYYNSDVLKMVNEAYSKEYGMDKVVFTDHALSK